MLYDLGKSVNNSLQRLFTSDISDTLITNTINDIIRQLLLNNVNSKCVLSLKKNIFEKLKENIPKGINKSKFIYKIIFEELCNLVDPKKDSFIPKKNESQIIVFVGLQGAGKTTSICKYANFYKKKKFKVGIICADTFRAGAFDQIKQNCLKINVPFYGSSDPDPVKVAFQGVEKFKKDKFEIILVDTSGRHTQENDLFFEMKEIIKKIEPNNIIFVMDAGIGQMAENQALGFKNSVDLGSIILTKTDSTENAGGALTSVAITNCPIEFIGDGEGMDDFEIFQPKRFINKLLGKGDLESLSEKIKDSNIDEKKMIDNLQKGIFRLKEFSDYMQQIMSLGPLNKLLPLIPGLPKIDMNTDNLFKKNVYIFDSMTNKELESDGQIFYKEPTRIKRIAKGSGTSKETVMNLLKQYEMFGGMMGQVSKNKEYMNMFTADPTKMSVTEKARYERNISQFMGKNNLGQLFKK